MRKLLSGLALLVSLNALAQEDLPKVHMNVNSDDVFMTIDEQKHFDSILEDVTDYFSNQQVCDITFSHGDSISESYTFDIVLYDKNDHLSYSFTDFPNIVEPIDTSSFSFDGNNPSRYSDEEFIDMMRERNTFYDYVISRSKRFEDSLQAGYALIGSNFDLETYNNKVYEVTKERFKKLYGVSVRGTAMFWNREIELYLDNEKLDNVDNFPILTKSMSDDSTTFESDELLYRFEDARYRKLLYEVIKHEVVHVLGVNLHDTDSTQLMYYKMYDFDGTTEAPLRQWQRDIMRIFLMPTSTLQEKIHDASITDKGKVLRTYIRNYVSTYYPRDVEFLPEEN